MSSFTKRYEFSITKSDPDGQGQDVVFVSFYEFVGAAKKLIAQEQFNPNEVPVTFAGEFAANVSQSLVSRALVE